MNEILFKKTIIPPAPGLLAAYGLLTEDLRRDFIQTNIIDLHEDTLNLLEQRFTKLENSALEWFDTEIIPYEKRRFEYFLDMRYKGQNHEIRIPFTAEQLKAVDTIRDEFSKAYKQLYSFCSDDMAQIVNFGLSAIGDIAKPIVQEAVCDGTDASKAIVGSRQVYETGNETVAFPLYARDKLTNGNIIRGPAIVKQMDSTTVILSGQTASVDKYLNIIIERDEKYEE